MELTEKNGHASIEEILASVRRIIAEEPGAGSPLIDLNTPVHHPRGDGLLEDPSDFDLPSMFKTPGPAAAADKPAPLFGRLSEAIRAASSGSGYNGEAARADQSLSALKLQRVEAGEMNGAPHFLLSTFHETTAPRVEELAASAMADQPVASAQGTGPAIAPSPVEPRPALEMSAPHDRAEPQPQPESTPQVPRQMAAFKDTRFRSMGAPPAAEAPAFVSPFEANATAALVSAADAHAASIPAAILTPAPAPVFEAPVSAAAETASAAEASAGLTAQIVASYPALAAEGTPAEAAIPVPPPVPVTPAAPVAAASPEASAPIEDSTADLLRPMLRQWLAENMPRMVEKALHIEVAETVKSTKK